MVERRAGRHNGKFERGDDQDQTITWIVPREAFHEHLRRLIRAGFGKRLMFGSDQMIWPETIELAVQSVDAAAFLTKEQRSDIFYNNAARFLRISDSLSIVRGSSPGRD